MSVSLFGSCRINYVHGSNDLNNLLNYTHSTKEVIQLIHFLKGEKNIAEPYNRLCFRASIIFPEKNIVFQEHFRDLFNESTLCVVEICSRKKYIHNEYYLHHLCVDKRFAEFNKNTPPHILNEVVVEEQTDEEIVQDITEIERLIFPKKLVIVSHYNSKKDGEYMEARNQLIELLEKTCDEKQIPFVNPRKALHSYDQESIMTSDLGHYTSFGQSLFNMYLNNFVNRH